MPYFRHRVTARPLADYVDSIWSFTDFRQPHSRERVLPTGTVDLVVSLDDTDVAGVSGVRTGAATIVSDRPISLLAVHFRPGSGGAFFDLPMGELQDEVVPLCDLWGSDSRMLHERLLGVERPAERVRIAERFLARRLGNSRPRSPDALFALGELENTKNSASVADIARSMGYTSRRFIELFRSEVGVSPKLFQRISRFRRSLQLLGSDDTRSKAEIAQACGYFDQAHLNHEFHAFAGISPGAYQKHRVTFSHVRVPE